MRAVVAFGLLAFAIVVLFYAENGIVAIVLCGVAMMLALTARDE